MMKDHLHQPPLIPTIDTKMTSCYGDSGYCNRDREGPHDAAGGIYASIHPVDDPGGNRVRR